MYLRRSNSGWEALAPAKLNLFLEILGRRGDGYHELETLMVPIGLYDSLLLSAVPQGPGRAGVIELSVRSSFTFSGGDGPTLGEVPLPLGEQNLIVRALELLQQRSGCRCGARVQLVKRIPMAAGLGGGSSDAAAALALANRAWDISWSDGRLAQLAADVGSDVPFFLHRRPAVCRGRGEYASPLIGAGPLHFVVVRPPEPLSTADVYRMHDRWFSAAPLTRQTAEPLVNRLRRGAVGRLSDVMLNRLQPAAARLSPWVGRLQDAFARLDFVAHQLSGSGSAYFGVCRNGRHAARLAAKLRGQRLGSVCATRCC